MTYLQFHLFFLLPPILYMVYKGINQANYFSIKHIGSLAIICCIAFVYTTPWDNLLVKSGVWGYGINRVIGTWGYVPIEEYVFFVLQPILTGLFLFNVMSHIKVKITPGQSAHAGTAHWIGTLVYTYLSLLGLLLIYQAAQYYYLALILIWASPILAIQWAYGGRHLWHNRRIFFLAVSIPTLYLWISDRIAIELGIWYISDVYTTGLHLLGLPIEEALFFVVTNLLVTQGIMLSVYKWDEFSAYVKRKKLILLGRQG